MQRFYHFARQEFRHIAGDQMLLVFLFAPLFCMHLYGGGTGTGTRLSADCRILSVHIYVWRHANLDPDGFISAFILLEEKTNKSSRHCAFSLCAHRPSCCIVCRGNIAGYMWRLADHPLGGLVMVGVAVPASCTSVWIIGSIDQSGGINVCRNKIEGLAYFKILDLVILTPILTFFFPGGSTGFGTGTGLLVFSRL